MSKRDVFDFVGERVAKHLGIIYLTPENNA